MYASVEKLSGYITRGVYTVSGPFHPFGGAVDIIVVQQQDGSFKSSPWYVRFGKFQGVLKTKEKVVTIAVNGEDAHFHMYLDHKGEAYFLRDVTEEGGSVGDSESPPSTSGDETDEKNSKSQISKTQSCHIDGDVAVIGDQVVVARRRSGIFGLFGRRSMKEDHTGVHRVSSLERAEIAADLLETNWSTNLRTADPRGASEGEGEHFEEVSVHGSPSEEIRDVSSSDGNVVGEDLGSSVISEVCIEERIMESEGGRRLEEVIEVTTLDNGELGESGLIYETVMTESKEFEVSPEGPILKNATFNVKSHGSSPKSVDSEQVFHESFDASVVEKGGKEVFTLSYCLPAESTNVEFSLSTDNGEESLNLPFCPREQFDHGDKVSTETSDLISEVKSQPKSSRHEDEDVSACGQLSLEISTTEDAVRNQANWPSNEAFEDAITNDLSYDTPIIGSGDKLIGSRSSCNSNLISSESEVPNHEEETLNPADGKEPSLEPIALHGNQPQMNGSGSVQPQHPDSSVFPDSSDQVQEIMNLEKGFEGESSRIPDGDGFAQKADNRSCSVETIKARVPSSENSDDDQFLFGDFDGIEAKGANTKQSLHDLAVKADDDTLFNSEGDAEECETKSVHDEQSRENIYEVSRAQTSPMAIPRSQAESDFVIRSLPIIRSHIHELGPSNHLHPLSCSLNMNSDRNEQGLHGNTSESLTPKVDSKTNMLLGRHISTSAPDLDPEKWGDQRGAPVNPAVELSLCRHLLFEGMGADSASQAFDAEKVNLEKFSALRSSIVTNKRLVVRIGDRYFPWDAAAPIILGMISFGQGEIFEPQGMIAVDRPGNILKGDAMGEMVPSGGSWRLWPFTFRKSKTITTVRATREGIIAADVDTTPESTKNSTGNAEAPKSKTAKKKEQTLIPTSEELASLNLKEGPNVITFTFSTAMLGRQQVDARIFLWKWNTRIVISDVDGTITKSDVLGQFMPMVGIDWSQTGVAHLFSAIKENGYQLLFLSARAISQAYITRQFLVNLKQDGKALPDGPVVISPDGLFPSLYREVIRRAPHEFKISCLEDIKALFPSDCSPFYAGFGNRDTDEVSYLKVGIPKGKIFIINPKGQVAVNRRVATKSYTSLHALVNGMFPPMSSAEQEDFNSWNYWKLPLPDIDV